MTAQEYLKNKLETCGQYKLTTADQENLKEKGLKEFLRSRLTRKEFRKWKLQEPAIERIENTLTYCLDKNIPITFRFRFGGYKLWRFESAPEVDWAEFFTISHYCKYLAPIAATHKPGIKMYFASDDVFVERLNNIPKSDTEAYYQSFQKLLDSFREYLPKNFEIDMIRHRSLFNNDEELEDEFSRMVDEVKDDWKEKRDSEDFKKFIKTSIMNVKWNGVEDLTKLSEEEKEQKIEQSAMYHDALVVMPTIREWSNSIEKIHLFSTSFPSVIAIGTTKSSIVRFWVGVGVLEKRDDELLDRILSIQQYKQVKDLPHEKVSIDFIPMKNFKEVHIYNQSFNFVKN